MIKVVLDTIEGEIVLNNSQIDIDSIKNIHAYNCHDLYIKNTPAGKTLLKEIRKHKNDISDTGYTLEGSYLGNYLNDIFKNIERLRYVYISPKKMIEYNKNTNKWYIV